MAYCNGTGHVTFLQSTCAEFTSENINYISASSDQVYSKHFQEVLKLKQALGGNAYSMEEPLDTKGSLLYAKGIMWHHNSGMSKLMSWSTW